MIKIRHIVSVSQIEDLGSLIFLIEKQIRSYEPGYDFRKKPVRETLANALRDESRAMLFLAFSDNNLIGFAFCNRCSGLESAGDYLWINELHTDEHYRNRGVAGRLLRHIELWCNDAGIKSVMLVTGPGNDIARKLYRSSGYSEHSVLWVDKEIRNSRCGSTGYSPHYADSRRNR